MVRGLLLALLVAAVAAAAAFGAWLRPDPAAPERPAAPDTAQVHPAEVDAAEVDPAEVDPAQIDLSAKGELARMMHQPRTVHVLVTNHGAAAVRVAEVELLTDSFVPTGPVAKDVTIPAGAARSLAVRYGEARCGGRAAPPLAPATAHLALTEPATTVELALPDQDEELALLLRRECAAQVVTRAVEVRFRDWSAASDGTLEGELVLQRRHGQEPVRLDAVAGNVLFQVTAAQLGGTVGQDRLAVPVVADANRCDGHAVGEAKQRFLLRIWVSVGEARELPVTVELDPADQPRFEEMQRVRCGL